MAGWVLFYATIDFGTLFLGFLLCFWAKTELFYQLSIFSSFIMVTRIGLQYSEQSLHHVVQANLITIWAVRMGCFLTYRIYRYGHKELRKAKENLLQYIGMFVIPGVMVLVCLFPSLINFQNVQNAEPVLRDYIGWGIATFGGIIEAIADHQKFTFKSDPKNAGKFISHGLWSISRHPNYLGNILFWFGVFLSASSSFTGLQYLSIISPILLYLLLTRISGVPPLEASGQERYGKMPEYKKYVDTVPVLIPFFGNSC